MPELDGAAVAREVRRTRDADRLPLILLTSLGRREDAEEALFAARLTKPIRPSQLYNVLLDVLGAAPARPAEERSVPADVALDAAPLRILVVEDNPVNRQLALLLLEKMGYRADVAVNGVEAVEAVSSDDFDVVLMDVQMPEMDGLEATRRIHERLGTRRPHIIAATANAMQEERDRCLAAGMDDYLSKPIRLEQLDASLQRVRPQAVPQLSAHARETTDAAEVLDTATLERLRGTLGDAGAGELIGTFLAETPKLVSNLAAAVESDDAEELRRAAHTLKSNASTFGATALADVTATLETMAAEKALGGAPELVARVEREYKSVRAALETAHGS
jgi:CheY-like chemotaxis protein